MFKKGNGRKERSKNYINVQVLSAILVCEGSEVVKTLQEEDPPHLNCC